MNCGLFSAISPDLGREKIVAHSDACSSAGCCVDCWMQTLKSLIGSSHLNEVGDSGEHCAGVVQL